MADRVTVIGWDGSPLEPAARSALRAATLVAAAPRHLEQPEIPPGAERVTLGSVPLAAERIARHRGSAVVVADGDPGFFGLVRALRDPAHGLEVEVVPAVSSVAAAFARAGMPWDDARIVVAGQGTLRRAVNVCRAHPKVAVLTAPGAGPTEIALMLRGVHRTFVVCERLGTPDENVTMVTPDTAVNHRWHDPNVVIVLGGGQAPTRDGWLAGGAPAGPAGWALEAADYGLPAATPTEGQAPLLRAAQLAFLGPRPGDLVWDVGTAGGLAAVEAARLGAAVIAVDRDAEACARATAGARAAGVELQVVHGGAPQALGDLPEPDAIRVGGGGPRTLRACADRRPPRIVTHALTRDEAESAGGVLAAAGYRVRCTLLQAVALDTETWSEENRNVAFLLSGSRT
ncbi:precorrin-6y C5,15-methyltransferase (decarboxylating) subunit CbiE [Streptomyces lonarensis]|uniref:Precorrin-6y C5,15-methyltransferase (Decarboxylating) subunit CbiE n=1 Tax=Streptomyces lonarensis TaxID=700599 RepID=A0A7X6D3Q4_9ACTN|nr:precorrin-6y C5,15-methyltransferase (decarboxylating) subunit CbiE [Streptomyces lonarensis]NJQ07572.1 precorrin-6y C5,15-methyltransferase (decarboxylating) subunit CbiE [Streptomyces lonarensis]